MAGGAGLIALGKALRGGADVVRGVEEDIKKRKKNKAGIELIGNLSETYDPFKQSLKVFTPEGQEALGTEGALETGFALQKQGRELTTTAQAKALADAKIKQENDKMTRDFITSEKNELLKTDAYKRNSTALDASSKIYGLLEAGNPLTASAVKIQFPRLLGEVGNLTEREQAAFGGGKSLLDRLDQAVEQLNTGKLTGENEAFMLELLEVMHNKAVGDLNDVIDKFSKATADASGGLIPIEKTMEVFGTFKGKPVSYKDAVKKARAKVSTLETIAGNKPNEFMAGTQKILRKLGGGFKSGKEKTGRSASEIQAEIDELNKQLGEE